MSNKFQVIVTSMKKKPYDYLDQRKMEFDSDFDEFKRQINELHVSVWLFLFSFCTVIWVIREIEIGIFESIFCLSFAQQLLTKER